MIKEIYDKETVIRWILHSDSEDKTLHIHRWINDRCFCYQMNMDRVPVCWGLWHWVNKDIMFIDYFSIERGRFPRLIRDMEVWIKTHGARAVRMATTRPGSWERLWPGMKVYRTIMQKEMNE